MDKVFPFLGKAGGGRGRGRGVYHPTSSSAEVKERVDLHFNSLPGPSWPVRDWPFLLPLLWNDIACT